MTGSRIPAAAAAPLMLIAEALRIVHGYDVSPHCTQEEGNFASVSRDDIEHLLMELLLAVTDLEDEETRDRFLYDHMLGYLVEDMRSFSLRRMSEVEICEGCLLPSRGK